MIAVDGQEAASELAIDGAIGPDAPPDALPEIVERMRARADARAGAPFEVWVRTPMPEDRAAWRRTRDDCAAAGATGLIVPADPRLLDLLRNGDEEDDRSDLALAQG